MSGWRLFFGKGGKKIQKQLEVTNTDPDPVQVFEEARNMAKQKVSDEEIVKLLQTIREVEDFFIPVNRFRVYQILFQRMKRKKQIKYALLLEHPFYKAQRICQSITKNPDTAIHYNAEEVLTGLLNICTPDNPEWWDATCILTYVPNMEGFHGGTKYKSVQNKVKKHHETSLLYDKIRSNRKRVVDMGQLSSEQLDNYEVWDVLQKVWLEDTYKSEAYKDIPYMNAFIKLYDDYAKYVDKRYMEKTNTIKTYHDIGIWLAIQQPKMKNPNRTEPWM
jgi:hypothetical protein